MAVGVFAAATPVRADDATIAALNAVRVAATCVRATGAEPAAPTLIVPLVASDRLDAAAAALAREAGATRSALNDVLHAAGYRATRSMSLQVGGVAAGAALARFIEQRYCAQITSAQWQEIGLYQGFSGTQAQAWLILAAPFVPPPAGRDAETAARVLELVNLARGTARNCGDQSFAAAAPVKSNALLARAGKLHAADMATYGYFSHDGRDGSKPADRATRVGYAWRAVGENIAAGQSSAEDAVRGWIDSPPHCANLMSPRFTEMGVAFAVNLESRMGIYWAQVFGTPR